MYYFNLPMGKLIEQNHPSLKGYLKVLFSQKNKRDQFITN